jgi:phosphoglycolate phosphatase-like HAD superfamily hydrolase
MHVIGRPPDGAAGASGASAAPAASADGVSPAPALAFGAYRARDGTLGARVALDCERPHVVLVVGKRGSGKSNTLGVIAEGLAAASGVRPYVADPMAALDGSLGAAWTAVPPRVPASALAPRTWCTLLDLDPAGGPGSLVWRAAGQCETLAAMRTFVREAEAPPATVRAAENHLRLAASWDVFDPAADGPGAALAAGPTVCALAGHAPRATDAVVAGAASDLFDACTADRLDALPWLVLDEAHVAFDGAAFPALRRVLTRGRQPGVSLVAATQRPSALPAVALSQADLLVVHRLTSGADRDALLAARPDVADALADRGPTTPGEALVVDDARATTHAVAVRERATHAGTSPRASETSTARRAVTEGTETDV